MQKNVPPPIDGSESVRRTIHKLHPEDSGESIELGPEFLVLDAERTALKADVKAKELKLEELNNTIKAKIGKATWGRIPGGGRFQWRIEEKNYKPREAHTTSSRVLRRTKR